MLVGSPAGSLLRAVAMSDWADAWIIGCRNKGGSYMEYCMASEVRRVPKDRVPQASHCGWAQGGGALPPLLLGLKAPMAEPLGL